MVEVNITRSDKRVKTVSARVVRGVLEVSAPAHMSEAALQAAVERLRARLAKRTQRQQLDDADLAQLARQLNGRYFRSVLQWQSISWSTDQNKRYGSCTPATQTIRISHQLTTMPRFVLEYVVMHELAHLVEANHGPRFWRLVNHYPRTERARGYLMAVGLEAANDETADGEDKLCGFAAGGGD